MIAVIVGAIVAALIALARWWHGREVITAEQRGRLDAIEQVRRDTEAAERDRAAALARVREDTAAAVDGARGSAPAGPVTRDEVSAWAKGPELNHTSPPRGQAPVEGVDGIMSRKSKGPAS